MRPPHLFVALLILIGTFVVAGENSQACGCIPAMTEAELAPYKAKAERGDAQAAGTVWFEYGLNGAPASAQQLRYWRSKAIRLADPYAISFMVNDWMLKVQDSNDPEDKRLFADTAVKLLNHAWRNRQLIPMADRGSAWDRQANYASDLRLAVGVQTVLRDGVTRREALANRGDATAAHHLAVYYFYGTLDQDKRAYWEDRASQLGDPDFAGHAVRRRNSNDDIRDIRRALRSDAPVHRIPNPWIRMVTLRDLNNRLRLRLKWQAEGR